MFKTDQLKQTCLLLMNINADRRFLVKTLLAAPALATAHLLPQQVFAQAAKPTPARKFKISLNAYSFNEPLRNGKMNLDDLLKFCAAQQFDAVDLTAYYFPGYPTVPPDDYLYHIKREAFRLGLAISGTGVRNDFTDPDGGKRRESIQLVKNWIDAAAKLGAPVIRIFSGIQSPAGYTRDQVLTWMVTDIKECVAYGKSKGVVVAIQNHHDFIKTAAQTRQIIEMVNSEWFGLILDIGSYRMGNPYEEIKKALPYAVSWQIKEIIYASEQEVKPDLKKLFSLIQTSGYRGYLPIETLGPGDPTVKVPLFLKEVKKALGEV
jgi:sugar phosphate isomerase/epimerase